MCPPERTEKDTQFKTTMMAYEQDALIRKEPKSYDRLRSMFLQFLEDANRHNHRRLLDKSNSASAYPAPDASSSPRRGACRQWMKGGRCSKMASCPWRHDPAEQWKPRWRSPSPISKGRGEDYQRNSRENSPSKPMKPQASTRATSPSGKPGRPTCYDWKRGGCSNGKNCDF